MTVELQRELAFEHIHGDREPMRVEHGLVARLEAGGRDADLLPPPLGMPWTISLKNLRFRETVLSQRRRAASQGEYPGAGRLPQFGKTLLAQHISIARHAV